MSLLDAWVSPERALVAVDTSRGYVDVGGGFVSRHDAFEAGKMMPHVAASTVIAHRGQSAFMAFFGNGLLLLEHQTFDAFEELAPQMLEVTSNQLATISGGADIARQDVVMVGWSEARGRMFGVAWVRTSMAEGFVRSEIGGELSDEWVSPWAPEWGDVPVEPCSPPAIEQLAVEQRARCLADGQDVIGGRLLVAEITRDVLSVTTRRPFART